MDSARRANGNGKNGYGKKGSSRVKELIHSYDEKHHHAEDAQDDIQNGVAHRVLNELEEHVNDLGESWETESLFEDIIGDITEDRFFTDGMCVLRSFTFGVLLLALFSEPGREFILALASRPPPQAHSIHAFLQL